MNRVGLDPKLELPLKPEVDEDEDGRRLPVETDGLFLLEPPPPVAAVGPSNSFW